MRHLWAMGYVVVLGSMCVYAAQSGGARSAGQIVLERSGSDCFEDPNCINRLHPDIPMAARAESGQEIVFKTRADGLTGGPPLGRIHPLSGPVEIVGARSGDTIAVTVVSVVPFGDGRTSMTANGLLADQFPDSVGKTIRWELGTDYATSEAIPNVRVPNRGFPGVITALPGQEQIETYLARERAGAAAGGRSHLPEPINAIPADICGPESPTRGECIRTGPPREHGGNMDIRYHSAGTTVYLPCYIDGCGLTIGDVHYAQGDGEVAGTAVEMFADVTVRVEVLEESKSMSRGPHFEGSVDVLAPATGRFYATVGMSFKEEGELPPNLEYLQSPVAQELAYLSDNLLLAARNALMEMIDYLVEEHGLTSYPQKVCKSLPLLLQPGYGAGGQRRLIDGTSGLTREQAYFLSSAAVDLRIGEVVDAGHVNVIAILPLDIFVER